MAFKFKGPCTRSPKFLHAFFSIFVILSYQKCMLRMWKCTIFLWRTKVSKALCNWCRIYFLTCTNFRLCVQWPLLFKTQYLPSTTRICIGLVIIETITTRGAFPKNNWIGINDQLTNDAFGKHWNHHLKAIWFSLAVGTLF